MMYTIPGRDRLMEFTLNHVGLTERKTFAMFAPECPDWFVDEWIMNNEGKYTENAIHEIVGCKCARDINTSGMMAIFKEWRYAYADLMIDE